MKRFIFLLFFFVSFVTQIFSQSKTEIPDLTKISEVIIVNENPALRILGRESQWIEVRQENKYGAETLIFQVVRMKNFGLGLKSADEGKLFISENNFNYEPNFKSDEAFSAHITDIADAKIEKARQGFLILYFKVSGKERKFVINGSLYGEGNYNNRREELRPAMNFLLATILDFKSALKEFNRLIAVKRN